MSSDSACAPNICQVPPKKSQNGGRPQVIRGNIGANAGLLETTDLAVPPALAAELIAYFGQVLRQ